MRRILLIIAIVVAAFAAAPAGAQQPRVPASRADIQLSFAPVVKRVAPAVVNVYALQTARRTNPFFDDPFFRRFFGDGFGIPGERAQRSLGSGVIVDPAGVVVTNFHVIENAEAVRIALPDKREFDAEILLRDQRSDLAVLRIKDGRERFPAAELGDSDAAEVGDLVLAIGNPFGVGQTVTQGIVSAVARTQVGVTDYQFFIQTDAAINPGNSGGALVDMAGRVIGINSAIYSRGGGSLGIGFAIPANMVRVVVESARGGSAAVRRPWFGAKLQAITPDIAESLSLKRPAGALVASVSPNSPAARAGLQPGDVIAAIDGQAVDDPNAFDYRFATKPLGGRATLAIERGGRTSSVAVPLETAPERPREEVVIKGRSPFVGARVANLSPALAEELRLDTSAEGVVIVEIAAGSTAAALGFRPGDVVLTVNGETIARTRDLERVSGQASRQWNITIQRGGQQLNVTLRG
ncbi:MAG: Do family serine endopeptidase [Bradyrhizobiaceae bacterium]|nr:Do family serine endopeptidase [Bradyrhizobiaceae bacterium]